MWGMSVKIYIAALWPQQALSGPVSHLTGEKQTICIMFRQGITTQTFIKQTNARQKCYMLVIYGGLTPRMYMQSERKQPEGDSIWSVTGRRELGKGG